MLQVNYRTLRQVREAEIEPGKTIAGKTVSGWHVPGEKDFLLDGKRCDHVFVTFTDESEEDMVLVRKG